MRKVAREVAFKLIYEYQFNNQPVDFNDKELIIESDLDENDLKYLELVYHGVITEMDNLKSQIEKYSEGYKLDRLYKIDLSILLLATYEILYFQDVPKAVAINEAVEMSKIYSTVKSGSFINGVLGAIAFGKK